MTNPLSGRQAITAVAAGWTAPADHAWTEGVVQHALRSASVDDIAARVHDQLNAEHVALPDADAVVRRCVLALLVGHLVLQGPPGTGKTSLSRALAYGFNVELIESTATSDWTPFHVVGGLKPSADGGMSPSYGKVTEAALRCAELVRDDSGADTEPQAAWLLIDEFNRADIDKAIGSLFTVLSSNDPRHLGQSPIDLWFEASLAARKLWIPSRFRLIASMNDLDTSFVSRISQGLARRFQFVTIGPPTDTATDAAPVTPEVTNALASAYDWLERTYGSVLTVPAGNALGTPVDEALILVQKVVDGLRHPSGAAGWPIGSAQVVDVLRAVLLSSVGASGQSLNSAVDHGFADRVVPQMSGIDDDQAKAFRDLFTGLGLETAATELKHLINPHELT